MPPAKPPPKARYLATACARIRYLRAKIPYARRSGWLVVRFYGAGEGLWGGLGAGGEGFSSRERLRSGEGSDGGAGARGNLRRRGTGKREKGGTRRSGEAHREPRTECWSDGVLGFPTLRHSNTPSPQRSAGWRRRAARGLGRGVRGFGAGWVRRGQQRKREVGDRSSGPERILRRQVRLRLAAIGQGDVDFNKVVEARKGPALAEPAPGLLLLAGYAPANPLRLSQRAPACGDRAEGGSDVELGRGSRVSRYEIGIRDLAAQRLRCQTMSPHLPALV